MSRGGGRWSVGGGSGGGADGAFKGAWSAGATYVAGDTVTHAGSTWGATTAPAVGAEPGVAGAWTLLSGDGGAGHAIVVSQTTGLNNPSSLTPPLVSQGDLLLVFGTRFHSDGNSNITAVNSAGLTWTELDLGIGHSLKCYYALSPDSTPRAANLTWGNNKPGNEAALYVVRGVGAVEAHVGSSGSTGLTTGELVASVQSANALVYAANQVYGPAPTLTSGSADLEFSVEGTYSGWSLWSIYLGQQVADPGVSVETNGEAGVVGHIVLLPPSVSPTAPSASIPTFTATHAAGVGTLAWYNDSADTVTITGLRVSLSAAAVDAATVVDVNVDGTTALAAPVSVAVGQTTSGKTADEIVVPAGAALTVDVDSVGTPSVGETVLVQFYT